MAQPILYSFIECPYSMRARMAIAQSGVSCEMREIDLKDKPQALLDISPNGTVPVVLLPGGLVLDQNLEIMQWALKKNDPEGWLHHHHEDTQKLIHIADNEFAASLKAYKYPDENCDPHKARDTCFEFLKNLEMRIAAKGFLAAEKTSFADIAIFPLIRRFALVDWVWFEDCRLIRLKIWLNYFMHSPLFKVAMEKYSPWQPGDPVDVFPIFNTIQTSNIRI